MKKILFLTIVAGLLLGGCTIWNKPQASDDATTVADITTQPTQKNVLDLSGQSLKKVPDNVFTQTSLEELNLSNNLLTGALQAEIRQLQNLKVLNASNNLMTGVPAEIGQLSKLRVLDLSNNQLTGLPYELGNLQSLQLLNISGNNYSTVDLGIIVEKLPNTVQIIK